MDPSLLSLIVCAALTLLGLVIVAVIARRAQARTTMAWLGLALIPIGIYLVGLVPRVIDGYNTLVQWFQGLTYQTIEVVGLVLLGLAALLLLISRFIPVKAKADRKPRDRQVAASTNRDAVTSAPSRTRSDDPEIDEATRILRQRGIE